MAVYDNYPSVDKDYNFPPEILNALSKSDINWYKGGLTPSDHVDTIGYGEYHVSSTVTAGTAGLPVQSTGDLVHVGYGSFGMQIFTTADEKQPEIWSRKRTSTGWLAWVLVADRWRRGGLLTTDTLISVPDGAFNVSTKVTAEALSLPAFEPGKFTQVSYGTMGVQEFVTSERYPRTFLRQKTSGGWQPWTENVSFFTGGVQIGTAFDSADTLRTGTFSVSTGTAATNLGLPSPNPGIIMAWNYGSADYGLQVFITLTSPSKWFTRFKLGGSWVEWTAMSSGGSGEVIRQTEAPITPGGFKVVPLAITLGQGNSPAPISRQYRIPFQYNAPITRWRMHITDRNPHNGEHLGAGIVINNVYVGDHASNGSFKSSPTRIGGAINLSNLPDGEWISAWRSEPLGDKVPKLTSYDYTSTVAPFSAVSGAYNTSNMNSSAVQFLDGNSTPLKNAAFDIWFEVETPASTPVIAVFGDSLASGAQATFPCQESVLSMLALRDDALPVHYAYSGNAMQDFADDLNSYKFTRWMHLDRADSLLWSMGHNDVYRGRTFTEMVGFFNTLYPLMKERVARNIYASTITKRNNPSQGTMNGHLDQWNAWLKKQVGINSDGRLRDVFDFEAVVNSGGVIRPEFDPGDHVHLNTAGYVAELNTITRKIITHDVPRDSGWRDITSLIKEPVVSGSLRIMREGNDVVLDFVDLIMEDQGTTWVKLATVIPAGFRAVTPGYTYEPTANMGGELKAEGPMRHDRYGSVWYYQASGGRAIQSTIRLKTNESWPMTRPGVTV